MPAKPPIGIFGGTFNPIHFGHLRSALELVEALSLSELRFMPAAEPPHRASPEVSAADRATMVERAIAGEPRFRCDRRELERHGPSYTVASLEELRGELGRERGICLIMGCDALLGLPQWHRWEALLDLAHLVIIARPGWVFPEEGVVAELLEEHGSSSDALHTMPAGKIVTQTLRPQDISATNIRALLQSGLSARYLLPESVLAYIAERGLYAKQE
ncbi:nicotinate-nucleotide adenylyltransferase [Congregibacter litoralis KT71]|uniref:Probable nicotinate-nucleotide adenylyltransferase n=1 Tax=Congregibacter litoralis KT71 TaxID=314285 RepID=A4A9N4_9GAMM|nr:nicotinate-nucleotide adenylyltransferase [Congregibacter litoralis KT71]